MLREDLADILTRKVPVGALDCLIPGRRAAKEEAMVAAWVREFKAAYGDFVPGSIVEARIVPGSIRAGPPPRSSDGSEGTPADTGDGRRT
jgi:hypothetical protein